MSEKHITQEELLEFALKKLGGADAVATMVRQEKLAHLNRRIPLHALLKTAEEEGWIGNLLFMTIDDLAKHKPSKINAVGRGRRTKQQVSAEVHAVVRFYHQHPDAVIADAREALGLSDKAIQARLVKAKRLGLLPS